METPPEQATPRSDPIARELPTIGTRREVRVAGIRLAGRRRRPSGEKAPLQRELQATGRLMLLAAIGMIGLWISLLRLPGNHRLVDPQRSFGPAVVRGPSI